MGRIWNAYCQLVRSVLFTTDYCVCMHPDYAHHSGAAHCRLCWCPYFRFYCRIEP